MIGPVARFSVVLSLAAFMFSARAHDGRNTPLPQPPRLAQADDASSAGTDAAACALTLRLADQSGKTIPGVVRLADASGQTIRPAALLPRAAALSERSEGDAAYGWMNRWYVLPGERTIDVPAGQITIAAFSGIASRQSEITVDLRGKRAAEVAVPIAPLAPALSGRWVAGNVHLHLKDMNDAEAERYVTEVAMADRLELVFLSYLERAGADATYISNGFTRADLDRFESKSGIRYGWGEEYRHNFPGAPGYGHVMFLDLPELILPASFGEALTKRGNDDGLLRPGIEAARKQEATVLWCHNTRGHEDIPSWVAGLIDGQIIFDSGATGDYASGFYRYLNVGIPVPISMGTDWFINDMAMTMVALEGEAATAPWLAALRAGRSWITNGTLLDFSVDGAAPGDRLARASGDTVKVRAAAAGRNDFLGVELVVNGRIVGSAASEVTDGGFAATAEVEVPVDGSAWVAARITPFRGSYDRPEAPGANFNEYGKPLFAHTSPVYIDVDGAPLFIPEAAESLIAELRSSMVTIRHTGEYTNDAERERVLSIYREAMAALKAKLGS